MKNSIWVFISFLFVSCSDVNNGVDRKLEPSGVSQFSNYNPEARLDSLGIELRDQGTPVANYVHAVRSGNLLFLAGKGPKQANGENITGKLGEELTLEEGYAAAREAGINQLSVLKMELGNLNKVKRIVSVHGMVNAVPDFKDHSKVINGYSDLMVAVFGDQGKHARAAVGMGSLPGYMAVEVEMVVEVYE
jgi:enamine deaminase RidA (YjgF/YER057c/UK114 family)